MKAISILAAIASLILNGCSGIVPSVKAAPANCGASACSAVVHTAWGYYTYETHQTARTFSLDIEIGLQSQPANGGTDTLVIPLAAGGGAITSIGGVVNYTPWTNNLSSFEVFVWTNGTPPEVLIAPKFTTRNNVPVTMPFSATYPDALHSSEFVIIFNDDLLDAKPTTISLGFTGTFK